MARNGNAKTPASGFGSGTCSGGGMHDSGMQSGALQQPGTGSTTASARAVTQKNGAFGYFRS